MVRQSSHNRFWSLALWSVALLALCASCRHEDVIFIPEHVQVAQPEYTSVSGFYLLNEGNMGSNKCTLDYYDYTTGLYHRNIFADANPTQALEMGDVGNDIGIYGSKLYAVVNCSNKIDVMDARTAAKVGQVDIPNCRYIRFHGKYAYVTSYAGPVEIDPDYKQRGYVAKIDTTTLQVVATCMVGFQPDELEIVEGKIYVANSGGYMVPNYENTLSVIDLATFKEEARVPIAINLQRVRCDQRGILWVASRGDYYETQSHLYAYDTRKQRLVKELDLPVGNMWLDGDSLYIISSEWSYLDASYGGATYCIVDTRTMQVANPQFIADGTQNSIKRPYGVAVNPITKDILVTDARNYVLPGNIYCFDRTGTLRWRERTGDIPAHIVFTK